MSEDAEPTIYLRPVTKGDRNEFLSLMRLSAPLHEPWIYPPTTTDMFGRYLSRLKRDDHVGLLVIDRASDAIAGCFNINNIVLGSFRSAALGYYVAAPFAGRGYMRTGLKQVIKQAVEKMGLHRLEANIQPRNARSIDLVKRCGFVKEGLSRDYLFIGGAWRDHERWAYLDKRTQLRPLQ